MKGAFIKGLRVRHEQWRCKMNVVGLFCSVVQAHYTLDGSAIDWLESYQEGMDANNRGEGNERSF